jgi:biofilm PGA synthesis protein PgaA
MRRRPPLVRYVFIIGYTVAIHLGVIISHGLPAAAGAELVTAFPWTADQNEAVRLARNGDTGAALTILTRLHNDHPADPGVAHDLIAVSVWAGNDTAAVELFTALMPGPQPDYVLTAVGLAYRHLGKPAEALVVYRQGLQQSPNNSEFITGEIHSLVDLDQIEPALLLAETDLRIHGDRLDVLLAAGFAASARKEFVEALRHIDRALKLDPANREARHDRILAIDAMGAPQIAVQLANDNPGIVSPEELRRIEGDAAAALVRWGVFEPPNEALRFAASDRAIAALDVLIARWTSEGGEAMHDIPRARFDRMVALRDRVRMADVLTEYDDLRQHHVTIPGYALAAVADAYLYFHQPEKARDLYLRGLETDPRNPETRLALFYAYVDLEDYNAAYREADRESADQAVWLYLKGLHEPLENPDRANADLAAANARLYFDELAEAYRRIKAMADAAPNNTNYLSALAEIYSARGWPRRAAKEYDISRALKPKNVTTEAAQARNHLDLREYRVAEAEAADLTHRFPENLEVQRLDWLSQVHDMAEIRLTVEPTYSSPTNVQGGSGIAIEGQIYSPPIAYNWRLFATEYGAQEQLPVGEGTVTLRRSALGIEYRGPDLVASLEGTINAYGLRAGTTLDSSIGDGRGGVRALADWSLNDNWSIGAGAELFALDTPLRALGNGITANSASFNVAYRESESSAFKLSNEEMQFSDGNFRSSLTGQYTRRLLTLPHFSIDGIAGLAGSQNSAGNDRPYFNPPRDALATIGVSIKQVIYRRYQFIYDHHLVITPGAYWEQGFGGGYAASVLYEHRLQINDVFEMGLGVTFGRQQYDGVYQNVVAALLTIRERF